MKKHLLRTIPLLLVLLVSGFATQTALAVPTGPAQGLAIDDTRHLVFTAVGGGDVTVLDVSDPAAPVLGGVKGGQPHVNQKVVV